jgi:hypothetical protein
MSAGSFDSANVAPMVAAADDNVKRLRLCRFALKIQQECF